MPNGEQKPTITARIFPTKNAFKRFLRKLGVPVHYTPTPGFEITEIPTYKDLNALLKTREGFFGTVMALNKELIKAEKNWDGAKGDVTEHENTGAYRDQAIDLYSKLGEMTDAIGPFTDRDVLTTEGNFAQNGTGLRQDTINITTYNHVIQGTFSIPREVPIIHNHDRIYKVAFFGHKADVYWPILKREVFDICDRVLQTALPNETDPQKRTLIEGNVKLIKDKFDKLIDGVALYEVEFESRHRSNLIGGGQVVGEQKTVLQHWNIAKNIRDKITPLILTDQQVHFTHTYKIIRPTYVDDNGNIHEIRNVMPNFKTPEEVDYGLDENGCPLEVGDGSTKFEGQILEKGVVLIDIYNGRTPRIVPEEFTTDCDLLDLAVWVYVSYDSYRDDLRDGRYHEKAISVMERIMTEIKTPYFKHPQTMGDIRDGKHAEITMNLNNHPRGPQGPTSIKMTIEPSHLNPAFDLRATGKTKHWGRKYYYDLQENNEQSPEPTISTRGAALYILHRVIEEVKYWGGTADPTKQGIVELLGKIGEATDGFDIGPNLGPQFVRWGQPLTRDIFRPLSNVGR